MQLELHLERRRRNVVGGGTTGRRQAFCLVSLVTELLMKPSIPERSQRRSVQASSRVYFDWERCVDGGESNGWKEAPTTAPFDVSRLC